MSARWILLSLALAAPVAAEIPGLVRLPVPVIGGNDKTAPADVQQLYIYGSKASSVTLGGLATDPDGNVYLADQGDGTADKGSILYLPKGDPAQALRIMRGLTRPGDVELTRDGRGLVIATPDAVIVPRYFGVSVRLLNLQPTNDTTVSVFTSVGITPAVRIGDDGWFHVPEALTPSQKQNFVDVIIQHDGVTKRVNFQRLAGSGTTPLGNGTAVGQTVLEIDWSALP